MTTLVRHLEHGAHAIKSPAIPAAPVNRRGMAGGAQLAMNNASTVPVKDVRCATLLSELVYRAAESHDEASFRQAQAKVEEAVGASLRDVRRHKSGGQSFLVGETDEAIYVAFQGTKSALDWLANLNFFHGHFGWQHHHHHSSSVSSASSISGRSSSSASSSNSSGSSRSSSKSRISRAHIGFLKRANSAAVSISELHAAAAAAGKRLVLTGHSLGGAVAVLTTVRLLRALSAEQAQAVGASAAAGQPFGEAVAPQPPHVRCISFATPAMANSDLLQEVTAAGWDQYITNIVMPEDPVVPFVNLLLKAPTSPTQPPALSPRSFFAGLDSPCPSPSSSSSSASESATDLSRSNSNESGLSLSSPSWSSSLTFDPAGVTDDISASFADAGEHAVAALQPLQQHLAAAADCWLVQQGQELSAQEACPADLGCFGLAMAGDAAASAAAASAAGGLGLRPSLLVGSTGSQELASWLAAARGAVKQQAGSQPSQRSFRDSSRCNSNSGNSLCSLGSEALEQWPGCSSSSSEETSSSGYRADSPTESLASPGSYRTGYGFGVPVVASWALNSPDSSPDSSTAGPESPIAAMQPLIAAASSVDASSSSAEPQKQAPDAAAEAAAAAAEEACSSSSSSSSGEPGPVARSQVLRQLRRLQQKLGSTRVGRWAWIGGALAAGARCASALAAPAAVTSQPFSLLALFPQALVGPAALAVLHFVGAAAYKAALPPSHPLGQQWVMTGAGLEPVAKPLTSYPRTGEGLGLEELGGLFPGHRMVAYRRRLATLVGQTAAPAAATAAEAAEQQVAY